MTGAIVAGIGATEFSKSSGRSTMQLAAEACRAAILDAGLMPADDRRHGHVHRRRQRRARTDAQPRRRRDRLVVAHARWWRRCVCHRATCGRRRDLGDGERGARVPGVQRTVAAPLRSTALEAHGARAARLVLQLRHRHAGQDVRALVPSLHARVRRDQRGLRALHGVGASLRRHQPEGVVLRATDHPRRPPGVAVDRRARAAALRLLPGERRWRGVGRHARRARARRRSTGGHHRGRRRAPAVREHHVELLPR